MIHYPLSTTCHSPLSGKLGNRIDIPQIKSGSVDILSKKWKWPDHAELLKTDDLFKYGCRCRIFHCANKWNRQNRALVFILWINFQIHTGYESEGCLDNLEIIYVAIRPCCEIVLVIEKYQKYITQYKMVQNWHLPRLTIAGMLKLSQLGTPWLFNITTPVIMRFPLKNKTTLS